MLFSNVDIYTIQIPKLGPYCMDPMAIRRGLLINTKGRCWEYVKAASTLEKELAEIPEEDDSETARAKRAEFSLRLADLEGRLAQAAFDTFPIDPIDGEGAGTTEVAALIILKQYLDWVTEKKAVAGN